MSDEELLPMAGESETGGFDIVRRGYDRRQVEDYIERVEVALGDADRLHGEDGERITALETELLALQSRVAEAERKGKGLPDTPAQVGERIATMLRLAEEEADELVADARGRAERVNAERAAALERRETEVAGSADAADKLRMEAQADAESLRARAQQEADDLTHEAKSVAQELLASAKDEADKRRRTAEEDIAILHDDARSSAREIVREARAEVEDLAAQRDSIAHQMDDLRSALAAAMKPLTGEPS